MNIFNNESNSVWLFIIIIVFGIAFILYKTLTKQKTENRQRQAREKEVKKTIKKYLVTEKNISNVGIKYIKVNLRQGKMYQRRDIYDVFIHILNPKTNKVIDKKAFEIEGFAKLKENPENDNDYEVDWQINNEFDYQTHWNLIIVGYKKTLWGIRLRSLFKKDRKKYLATEKKEYYQFHEQRQKLDSDVIKLEEKPEIFRPEKKKTDE